MKLVPHNTLITAYRNWGGDSSPHAERNAFWDFIGEPAGYGEYNWPEDSWRCTTQGAKKIELMCSPHWKTLLKAYEAKYGEKEHTL